MEQQIFRAKATRQRIAATIRSALLSIEKGPLPRYSGEEPNREINSLKNQRSKVTYQVETFSFFAGERALISSFSSTSRSANTLTRA